MGRRPASRPLGGRVRARRAGLTVALASVATALGCSGFDTSRDTPPREARSARLYGLICDRVGAPEGAARRHHRKFPTTPSATRTPRAARTGSRSTRDASPTPHRRARSTSTGTRCRWRRSKRIARTTSRGSRRFGRDLRVPVIAALDATIPDIQIALKDLANADKAQSCGPSPPAAVTGSLHGDLARQTVGNLTDLYDDRTIPLLTEAMGHVLDTIKQSPDAQSALSRMDARQGYRPSQIALGVAQPILAYPQLVDLASSLLSLLASDSSPLLRQGRLGPTGAPASAGRTPVPGAASGQSSAAPARAPRGDANRDPEGVPVPPAGDPRVARRTTNDPTRTIYTRPLDDLEITRGVLFPSLSATPPSVFLSSQPLVLRDPRGVALVPLVGGVIPAPFVDADGDGLADLDSSGDFVTADGSPVPSPFFSIDGIDGPRQNGLAVNGALPDVRVPRHQLHASREGHVRHRSTPGAGTGPLTAKRSCRGSRERSRFSSERRTQDRRRRRPTRRTRQRRRPGRSSIRACLRRRASRRRPWSSRTRATTQRRRRWAISSTRSDRSSPIRRRTTR